MIPVGAWLTTAIPALATQIFVSLGFGVITYLGLDMIKEQIESYLYGAIGQIPSDILMLVNIAGFADAVNIVMGAITSRFAFQALKGNSFFTFNRS